VLRLDPNPFGFESLTYVRDVEESKALNRSSQACVIIAASGMCEAGRVLHHLRHGIQDPKNCVLIVGYQAENTLGRRIREKHPKVKIFGDEYMLRAEVETFDGFSAHADGKGLRDYAFHVHARSGGRLKDIFLVHGENEARDALAAYLRESLKINVHCPGRGDVVER
jgi:metallo-beta-lactamase family protein